MNVAELQTRYEAACAFGRPVDQTAVIGRLQQFFVADVTIKILASAQEFMNVLRPHPPVRSATKQETARLSEEHLDAWYKKKREFKAAWCTQAAKAAQRIRDSKGLTRIMGFQHGFPYAYERSCKLPDGAIVAIGAAARGNTRLFEQWLPLFEVFEAGAWQLCLSHNKVLVMPLPEVVLCNGVAVVTWPELRLCLDDHSRLHCTDGPALIWRNRWPQSNTLSDDMRYYLHGVEVQPDVILRPYNNKEKISYIERVNGETAAELHKLSAIERIEQFPPEQAAVWPEYVARWEAIGLATEPADRALAEEGVRLSYAAAGLRPPQQIIWTLSPLTSVIPFAKLFTNTHGIFDEQSAARVPLHIYKWTTQRVMNRLFRVISFPATKFMQPEPDSPPHRRENKVDTQARQQTLMAMNTQATEIWSRMTSFPHLTPYGPMGRVRMILLCGQHDVSGLVNYAFYREICGLVAETEPLIGPLLIAQSAGWWLPSRDICWISERPCRIQFDEHNRLHRVDGPAIEYRDGWGAYSWHGVSVPEHVVLRPEAISLHEIETTANVEVRRVLLERYGEARYIEDIGAEVIDEAEYGTLYRCIFQDDEPLMMLRVLNSTPEPDGSYRTYWLRVPPHVRTAHEAVAWTFGLTPEQYHPRIES